MNGSCRKKLRMTGKKSLLAKQAKDDQRHFERSTHKSHSQTDAHPKRFKNPTASTSIPMKVHLKKTRSIPVKKHTVPLSFCFRAKK